ncbi:hypothetical protein ACT53X_05525 [Leptospira interrogans]
MVHSTSLGLLEFFFFLEDGTSPKIIYEGSKITSTLSDKLS